MTIEARVLGDFVPIFAFRINERVRGLTLAHFVFQIFAFDVCEDVNSDCQENCAPR